MKSFRTDRKIIIRIITILILVLFVVPFLISAAAYEQTFMRVNTSEPRMRALSEFSGLRAAECTFSSDHGHKLAGYEYYRDNTDVRGVIIISHGIGYGGQNEYMDVADYFTSHGYLVFSYDATGTDRSSGYSVNGLPQGVIDLDHAIDYVEKDSSMKKYPIFLFGHSWGGYCAGAVLNIHPEIKAVVSVAGFDSSNGIMKYKADKNIGIFGDFLDPYLKLYDRIKFGKYSALSSSEGFAATKAGVMILQSSDDTDVPETLGYDIYHRKFGNNSRFIFKLYSDRDHMYLYYTPSARRYTMAGYAREKTYFKDHKKTAAAEKAYWQKNFDKSRAFRLDTSLMKDITAFYDSYATA